MLRRLMSSAAPTSFAASLRSQLPLDENSVAAIKDRCAAAMLAGKRSITLSLKTRPAVLQELQKPANGLVVEDEVQCDYQDNYQVHKVGYIVKW